MSTINLKYLQVKKKKEKENDFVKTRLMHLGSKIPVSNILLLVATVVCFLSVSQDPCFEHFAAHAVAFVV